MIKGFGILDVPIKEAKALLEWFDWIVGLGQVDVVKSLVAKGPQLCHDLEEGVMFQGCKPTRW